MSSTYYILVVVNPEDRIVASGTLMMERKFVHNLGIVGHVEDLAVARDQKGKKMGLRVLEALVHVAQTVGCYKVCLAPSQSVTKREANSHRQWSTAPKPTKPSTHNADSSAKEAK